MRPPSRLILGSLIVVALGAASCQPAVPPPPTVAAAPVALASPTSDTLVTLAPTETAGPPPSSTATATPIPKGPNVDFSRAFIYAVAHLETGQLQVTIKVPGGVKNTFNARIDGNRLPCTPLSGYSDRLACIGAEPAANYRPEGATLELYPLMARSAQPPLFQATFTLPAQSTPTTTPLPWYPPLPSLPFP
jgi:hypothetical protein